MARIAPGPDRHCGRSRASVHLASMVAAAVWLIAAGAPLHAQAPAEVRSTANVKIPELASSQFAWLALGVDWLDPPAGLRGPVKHDPNYPRHGNRDGPGQVTPHIGNAKDPVLKPWAAKQMQDSNDEVHSGKRGLPFS